MRKFASILVLALVVACSAACSELARPGEVGIKVNNYGTFRGVESIPIQTGRIWYNPWTEDVYIFPTYIQRVVWEGDEAITFRSKEGMGVTADVAVALKFTAEGVPSNYIEFKKSAEEIADGYIRDRVRDALGAFGNQMPMMDILGSGTQRLIDDVTTNVQAQFKDRSIILDSVSIIGKPRVDAQVEQSINAVLTAVQRASEAEQKVRESAAQANQAIEAARGRAESVRMEAEAQAKANQIIAESLRQYGDAVLKSKAIEKWDGTIPPQYGTIPLPFVGTAIPR